MDTYEYRVIYTNQRGAEDDHFTERAVVEVEATWATNQGYANRVERRLVGEWEPVEIVPNNNGKDQR